MEVDIRKYDLFNQTMTLDQSNKQLLALKASREDYPMMRLPVFPLLVLSIKVHSDVRLKVPGVAENRPSVLRGDCIKVSMSDDKSEPITVYKGYVHRVEMDSVKLGFANRYGEDLVDLWPQRVVLTGS